MPKGYEIIFKALEEHQEPIFFVGGCLRQHFLQKPIHDYDFVIQGSAIALARFLGKRFQLPFFVLDEERDIARIALSKEDTLDFASLQGGDLEEDLKQRDLTLNAMAYPVSTSLLNGVIIPTSLIDPLQGLYDLEKGLIRGVQEDNFVADPLRMVRVFRFAAQYNFSIESQTLSWIKNNAVLIHNSANERILSEMVKTLNGLSLIGLQNMIKTGLLGFLVSAPNESLYYNALISQELKKRLANDDSAYLQRSVTGERKISTLLLLYTLMFSHCIVGAGKKSAVDNVSSGVSGRHVCLEEIRCIQSKSSIYGSLSNHGKAFFQRLHHIFFDVSTRFFEGKVSQSRCLRIVKEDILGAYLVHNILYQKHPEIEPVYRYIESMKNHWLDPNSSVAHPQNFLTGYEVTEIIKQRPGPQIGKMLSQLLDAQADKLVYDRQSAIAYLKLISTNDSE